MFVRAEEGPNRTVRYFDEQGRVTIYSGGTRAWRNNNPGNIRAGEFANRHGAIGMAGGFAVFPDYATGRAAVTALLQTRTYQRLTIAEAIARYAPPTENDTAAYQDRVRRMTGLDPSRRLNDLSEEELSSIADAIEQVEGYRAGTITGPSEEGTGEAGGEANETRNGADDATGEEGAAASPARETEQDRSARAAGRLESGFGPPAVSGGGGGNVVINGRTAVHAGSGGVVSSPDVCKAGGKCRSVVFTNVARSTDAANTASTVSVNGNPSCKKDSIFSRSTGDEGGNCGGVRSGTIKGKAEFITASSDVLLEGQGAARQLDLMVSNNRNTPPMPLQQPGAGTVPPGTAGDGKAVDELLEHWAGAEAGGDVEVGVGALFFIEEGNR